MFRDLRRKIVRYNRFGQYDVMVVRANHTTRKRKKLRKLKLEIDMSADRLPKKRGIQKTRRTQKVKDNTNQAGFSGGDSHQMGAKTVASVRPQGGWKQGQEWSYR